MDFVTAQVTFMSFAASAFLSTVLALVFCLSLLRQMRSAQMQRAFVAGLVIVYKPMPRAIIPPLSMRETREHPRVRLRAAALAQTWTMPIQHPHDPEQVVIAIEPDDGPTRNEQHVQRLIEFLKERAG